MTIKENIPFCDIRIDKDGVWYYKGAEMFRKEIVNFFYQNLKRDESGQYLIELENDRCYLDVEDTPFVIRSVHRALSEKDGKATLYLLLSDETVEPLNPETLRIGNDNVLYCTIKNDRFDARFSRASYYQLANDIEYDDCQDIFFIYIDGRRFYIKNK
jgi:hypothetical protein